MKTQLVKMIMNPTLVLLFILVASHSCTSGITDEQKTGYIAIPLPENAISADTTPKQFPVSSLDSTDEITVVYGGWSIGFFSDTGKHCHVSINLPDSTFTIEGDTMCVIKMMWKRIDDLHNELYGHRATHSSK